MNRGMIGISRLIPKDMRWVGAYQITFECGF